MLEETAAITPGFLSVVPILITLGLALWTRNVNLSLFVGIFSGVLILNGPNPITGVNILVDGYLIEQMANRHNVGVIIVTALICGLVGLMEKSGGAMAFAGVMVRFIKTKVSAQLAAWFSGVVIFFTDNGTPLLIGPLFRPITDKLKVSRVKLAWIIDSTASPVSVLVPFISWGIYAQSLIRNEYAALGIAESEWTAFLQAIPFQLYSILAVLMVPLIALSKFDFSVMKQVEANCEAGIVLEKDTPISAVEPEPKKTKALYVWLPLIVMGTILFGLLFSYGFPYARISGDTFLSSLSTAYLFATICLIGLLAYYGAKKVEESLIIYFSSIGKIVSVLTVLVLAWSLGALSKDLQTAQYVASLADGNFQPAFIPVITFILCGVISFATGSSWGTYAIMMPLTIALAHQFGAPMHVCIGAVLSGGLFGDHCSPISDTTIISATGAGCSQFDHVRTQLPYALTNGGVCIIAFLFAGFTGSVWSLVLGFVLLVMTVFALNKFSNTIQSEPSHSG